MSHSNINQVDFIGWIKSNALAINNRDHFLGRARNLGNSWMPEFFLAMMERVAADYRNLSSYFFSKSLFFFILLRVRIKLAPDILFSFIYPLKQRILLPMLSFNYCRYEDIKSLRADFLG